MTFRFELNPHVERDLARDPAMQALVSERTRRAFNAARRIAPEGRHGGPPYRPSLVMQPARLTPAGWVGAYGSDGSDWHLVEYGSVNNHPYRVLERAAREAGLDFEATR